MSIIKITNDLIESVTLTTHPKTTFVSSSKESVNDEPVSSAGITSPTGTLGQISLMARSNRVIKSLREYNPEDLFFNATESALFSILDSASSLSGSTTDIQRYLGYATDWPHTSVENTNPALGGHVGGHIGYMDQVTSMPNPAKNEKVFNITRFRPPYIFQNIGTYDTIASASFEGKHRMVKNQVRNILLPHYRAKISHPNYAYTNYHSLNFFTGSSPNHVASGSNFDYGEGFYYLTSSVLMYPDTTGSLATEFSSSDEEELRTKRFNGKYAPESAFTFDFYINPRYSGDTPAGSYNSTSRSPHFRAGTIFHMSSTYAISLVSGSSKDDDGSTNGYRLLLQLSQSADFAPSSFKMVSDSDRPIFKGVAGNYKADPFYFSWVSPDNSLKRNHWHHVAIRWSPKVNGGTGSFVIDGNTVSEFCITGSKSIRPFVNQTSAGDRAIGDFDNAGRSDPNALFIGNFYEGTNRFAGTTGGTKNTTSVLRFFNLTAQKNEGFEPVPVEQLQSPADLISAIRHTDPTYFRFVHPLNAEVHDLKIYNTYRTHSEILTSSANGPDDLTDLLFYVPPFYTFEKHDRRFLSTAISSSRKQDFADSGGAHYDDDEASDRYPVDTYVQPFTSMPFNAGLSMCVDATIINLENFTKDFVTNRYPRLLFLTASSNLDKSTNNPINASGDPGDPINLVKRHVADYFYSTGTIAKRCLSVLPCDNGKFQPNYGLIFTASKPEVVTSGSEAWPYRDDLGNFDPSLINLSDVFVTRPENLILGDVTEEDDYAIRTGLEYWEDSATYNMVTPDNLHCIYFDFHHLTSLNAFGSYQASRDPSSNEIVLFNIPNLFYGNRIEPGTVTITDSDLSGSRGRISITLKDDGHGSLYRADSDTEHATGNCVGNIFYNEGVVLIKSPHLNMFGKKQFKMEFNGEQNIHVMSVNVPCVQGLINSSSNPGFKVLSASLNANDSDPEFVYITGIYLHDDNMNVIMKANLSQPVVKRESDDFLFRVKMDF